MDLPPSLSSFSTCELSFLFHRFRTKKNGVAKKGNHFIALARPELIEFQSFLPSPLLTDLCRANICQSTGSIRSLEFSKEDIILLRIYDWYYSIERQKNENYFITFESLDVKEVSCHFSHNENFTKIIRVSDPGRRIKQFFPNILIRFDFCAKVKIEYEFFIEYAVSLLNMFYKSPFYDFF